MGRLYESTKENNLSMFVSNIRVLYRFVQKNVVSRTIRPVANPTEKAHY